MHPKHFQFLKAWILVHLQLHESLALSDQPWRKFQEELAFDFADDFPDFFNKAVLELVDDRLIVVVNQRAFLRRALENVPAAVRANLATSIRIAGFLKGTKTNPDEHVPDPFDLNEQDIDAFVSYALAAFEQFKEVNGRAESLKREVGELKKTLKKYQDNELKGAQERNRQLKEEKKLKAKKALDSHTMVSGVCSKCGLSERLIKDSIIHCDGNKAAN